MKFIKPTPSSVFLGLFIATVLRMLWFALINKKITDPLGLTSITIAAISLAYLVLFGSRNNGRRPN